MKIRHHNFCYRYLSEVAALSRLFRRQRILRLGLLIPVMIGLSIAGDVSANDYDGTYGATFLNVPVGARVMAIPDVVAAMRPDASMAFSNPAVLSSLPGTQMFMSTANWLDELSLSAASLVVPFESSGISISFASRLLYSGSLQGFDASNQVVEEDSYYGLTASTGVSKQFEGIGLALGADINYVREHVPADDGDGITMSLGASYQFNAHRVDAFARDLGGTMSYPDRDFEINARYTFGYGYMLNRPWGRLDMGAQLSVAENEYQRLEVGANYLVNHYLSLRSGYYHGFSSETALGIPLTAGFGVHYRNLTLDYAFTEHEYFSNTHTFSVVFGFGQGSTTAALDTESLDPIESTYSGSGQTDALSPVVSDPTAATLYAVVAGIHTSLQSARAEVRALSLLNVPAVVEQSAGKYRVVVGQYDSIESAQQAMSRFERGGYRFSIVSNSS